MIDRCCVSGKLIVPWALLPSIPSAHQVLKPGSEDASSRQLMSTSSLSTKSAEKRPLALQDSRQNCFHDRDEKEGKYICSERELAHQQRRRLRRNLGK
jgi:hypothetical protein